MPTFLVAALSGTAAGVSVGLLFIYLGKILLKRNCIDALYERLPSVRLPWRNSSKNGKNAERQNVKSDSSSVESEEEDNVPKRVRHELVTLCQTCRKISTQANPCPCEASGTTQSPCRLQLLLLYNFHDSRLFIQIICALNVPMRWHGRFPSTQVRFQLLPDVWNFYQTEIQRNKSQPIYNETFEFVGYSHSDLIDLTLRLGLFAFDKFSQGHMIGYITLPLREVEWNPNQPTILWRELEPKSQSIYLETVTEHLSGNCNRPEFLIAELFKFPKLYARGTRERLLSFPKGELHISLRYERQASRVSAIVLKATNLPKNSVVWSTVPYVSVSLVFNGKTVETRQTKKKRSQNPVWNQGFLFDVDVNQVELYSFVFKVMDYDLLLNDQLIGEITVGSNQPDESSGKKHWDEMMRKANEHKKRETAMCHAI